jgi:hypothetical protein
MSWSPVFRKLSCMMSYRIKDYAGRIKECMSDRKKDREKPASVLTATSTAARVGQLPIRPALSPRDYLAA